MRQYDILYRSANDSYLIIAKDPDDSTWFVFQDQIEDAQTAKVIVDALNASVNK
jgi:hypothetical protein